jgi:hypothetical protein
MKKKTKHSNRRRNAAPSAPRSAPRARRLPIPDPPDWRTALASVLGGGGSALLGGFLAEQGWDQQMVSIAMTTGGVVGALALPGHWRVAANGIAASGAGQLALATAHKMAVNKVKNDLGNGAPPKRNALPSAVHDAFASTPYHDSSIDDVERMTDTDLALYAA